MRGSTALGAQADAGIRAFALPVETPAITISQIWHPSQDTDPAHRWLRALNREICHEESRHD